MMKTKEEVKEFLLELRQSNKLIVVEGPKDKKALEESGISNYIVVLTKKPIFEIIENISKMIKIAESPQPKGCGFSQRFLACSESVPYLLAKASNFGTDSDITKDVVILTDFDKKGKELYGKLNSGLQKYGVRVDRYFREWLQKNTKLSHVEGLTRFISDK